MLLFVRAAVASCPKSRNPVKNRVLIWI